MGKSRRNKTKLRPHQIPDDEYDTVEKPDADNPEPIAKPTFTPVKVKPELAGEYVEGMVVVCPDTQKCGDGKPKTGTITQVVAGEVEVLDSAGILHRVPMTKIYRAQN